MHWHWVCVRQNIQRDRFGRRRHLIGGWKRAGALLSQIGEKVFEDFLYLNTRLEKGSLDKDKYGFLERENGVYYFKLNVKIGLVKR